MKFESSSPQKFSRRAFLCGLLAVPMLGIGGCALRAFPESRIAGPGLGALARQRGKLYGAAMQSGQLDDPDFAAAMAREAALIVPENELKWAALRPATDQFDFSGYRRLADFTSAHGLAMRGHTLLWHEANPAWLEPALTSRRAAEKTLAKHIRTVLRETSGTIREWDVVNEAVHPSSSRADGLRDTLWLRALGAAYIPLAYHLAHEADPALTLVYNEYSLEYLGQAAERKRLGVLKLLENLVSRGAPLHALGLQSHLRCDKPLDLRAFENFLARVRDLGLDIIVTEMDLNLTRLSGAMKDKVRIAQNYVRVYLDAVQAGGRLNTLLTWGLSDRYSWMSSVRRDPTGALPLDANLNRGELWETLRERWVEN